MDKYLSTLLLIRSNIKYFSLISVLLFCNAAQSQANRIKQSQQVFSTNLNEERTIEVSLPANYETTQKDYPVLYLLDGEYIFNYAKGTVDFLSNSFGYLPDMIIVSIPNTDRNRDLFVTLSPQGSYLAFIAFLEQELLPMINASYRTNGFNILYGWSSASAVCTYLFANIPNLFDGYIETGTAIGNKFAELLTQQVPLNDYTNKFLYANTEGLKYLNSSGGPRVKGFTKYSALINYLKPKGLKWQFDIADKTNHVGAMPQGLHNGLKFIFSDFYIADSLTVQGAKQVITYYKQINAHYSFDVEIPVGALNESAFILVQEKKIDEATKLIKYGLNLHPESYDLLGTLAELNEYNGNTKLAAEYYKLAMEKASSDLKTQLKYKTLYNKLNTE